MNTFLIAILIFYLDVVNKYVVVFSIHKTIHKAVLMLRLLRKSPPKLLFANFSKLKREGYNFGGRCNASEHIGTLSTYLTIGSTFY